MKITRDGSTGIRMAERRLPIGMTPRLLSRVEAATYCGVSPPHFDEHIARMVPALKLGKRNLWDVKALDRWLDQKSGLTEADRPIDQWLALLGDDETDQGH
jgi:hypothetical protein